jgi:cytochrome c556
VYVARLARLIGVAVLATGSTAKADSPQTTQAVIETRQAGFKKMGSAFKAITEQLKTESPSVATLAAPAEAISAGAGKLSQWFPAGSGTESGVETDALPNIWSDRAKFDALMNELVAEARSLSAAIATNDVAALRAQAKRTGGVCSSCHKSFRAD